MVDKASVIKFELWPWLEERSVPATPHVCEVLGDGSVQSSTVLRARPPTIDRSCIVPFGRAVSTLPTVYTVEVPISMSLIPTGYNSIARQIFLSRTPCILGNLLLGVSKYESSLTSKCICHLDKVFTACILYCLSSLHVYRVVAT